MIEIAARQVTGTVTRRMAREFVGRLIAILVMVTLAELTIALPFLIATGLASAPTTPGGAVAALEWGLSSVAAVGVLIAIASSTVRRAWGWLILTNGFAAIALPVVTMMVASTTGASSVDVLASSSAASTGVAFGALLAGAASAGFVEIVSIPVEIVLLAIAFFVLRNAPRPARDASDPLRSGSRR